jgi:hypothetical protein
VKQSDEPPKIAAFVGELLCAATATHGLVRPTNSGGRRSRFAAHGDRFMLFSIGDYLAGILIGVATTLAVRGIVWPGMDMVLAMLIGMAAGMVIHLLVGLILAPLVGMFETMMPGSLIGMYGGMLFGMRDSMGAGSPTLASAAAVGAIFGAIVVLALKVYDHILRGATFELDS